MGGEERTQIRRSCRQNLATEREGRVKHDSKVSTLSNLADDDALNRKKKRLE